MSHPFKHLRTILKHRHQVIRNGWHLGIFWHCLGHDLSKFGRTEFKVGSTYYVGTHSPIYEERLRNGYFSSACQHHTRRNKHHWEYWTDFFKGRIIAKNMPYKYALEYVADTLSASKTYDPKNFKGATTLEYFNRNCPHYYLTDTTEEFIRWCLTEYAENGWKNLKKKNTKKIYNEIETKYPKTKIFDTMKSVGDLPLLKEGI
ncbi:MAG: catalase [Bacilli bacterium]|nr:catalase [Bacilli bacterium]